MKEKIGNIAAGALLGSTAAVKQRTGPRSPFAPFPRPSCQRSGAIVRGGKDLKMADVDTSIFRTPIFDRDDWSRGVAILWRVVGEGSENLVTDLPHAGKLDSANHGGS